MILECCCHLGKEKAENPILSTSSYDDCCNVMNLLQAYNLDLPHYIPAAAVEQNWTEAARLFYQKIDPDVAGFTLGPAGGPSTRTLRTLPNTPNKNKQQEQEESNDVANHVMDAVI